jgi:hypothetical protein
LNITWKKKKAVAPPFGGPFDRPFANYYFMVHMHSPRPLPSNRVDAS